MILFALAFLGGMLTIASPCILPVLPFVFAQADRPFARSGLPMLLGMALTFAAVGTLAAFAGGWAVAANQYGRIAAVVLLGIFGITLLFPKLADHVMKPLVSLGERLSQTRSGDGQPSRISAALLGVATGLLWAPCAGPILGLILTGAALQGASARTSLLLLSYAAGASVSLALALLVGGRVFIAMKRSLGAGEWIRRGLGVLVLVSVVAIAFGLDTGAITQLSLAGTNRIEQALLEKISPQRAGGVMAANGAQPAHAAGAAAKAQSSGQALPDEGPMPALDGVQEWLNSPPLTVASLKGKVVLVDFWTYSCINCLRTLPYVRAWAKKYKDYGLVVIGVHSPEFAFERNVDNVKKAIANLKIDYPVAIDNQYAIWRAFGNQYWPAHYFIDARGHVRDHDFGEGNYEDSEWVIQQLLAEAGHPVPKGTGYVKVEGQGATEAASDNVKSYETYVGYKRAENFKSPGGQVKDAAHTYTIADPALNQWGLSGSWTIHPENAALDARDGAIVFRFHARDLHLVLGPGTDGKPVRYRVTIDGAAPGDSHGADTDAQGNGTVSGQRLYQLVRQSGAVQDRTFEIRFLDPEVQAYAFTFG